MITIKNHMLYGSFGKAVTDLAGKRDLKPSAKLSLIKIYAELEKVLGDIEKVKPEISNVKEPTDTDSAKIEDFNEIINNDTVIDLPKICINDVVELLSTQELLVLRPILSQE